MGIVRHPNWELAERLLGAVVPGAKEFRPDSILAAGQPDGVTFPIYEPDPPAVTEELIAACAGRLAGQLVVVTGESHGGLGPFFVDADRFDEFARGYPDEVDAALVSGDTIIVSPATGTVIVVHHSEFLFVVEGNVASWPEDPRD